MDIKSMIQEKILVEAEFSKKPNFAGIFWLFLAGLFGFCIIIVLILEFCGKIDSAPIEFYLSFSICTFVFLMLGIGYTNSSADWGYEFYVTAFRVVGRTPLGQLISIPLEQISSVETRQGVLIIKTPSTTLEIPYISNLALIFAHISNLTAANKKQMWRI